MLVNNRNEPCGILAINKSSGWTSHDVVAKLRGLYHIKKIGHTGTLDPLAEGLLLVCVGKATKVIRFFERDTKTYEARICFGAETDTYDSTGTVICRSQPLFSRSDLDQVLTRFTGDITQKPPIYSALKKNGKKYYEYAREGKAIDIPERPIHISEINITNDADFPNDVDIKVTCSAGTYIRSLCHDIGHALGTHACMARLKRLSVGSVSLDRAHTIDEIESLPLSERKALLTPIDIFLTFPKVYSKREGDRFIENGGLLHSWNTDDDISGLPDKALVRLYRSDGLFIGVGQKIISEQDPSIKPLKLLI